MTTDLSVDASKESSSGEVPNEVAVQHGTHVPVSTAPVTSDGIDTKALLNSLRRTWFVAVLLGVIAGGAAAYGAWKYVPAPYMAFSELRISSVDQKILFNTAETTSDFSTYKQTQLKLITSPFVLNAAIREPDIAKLPLLQSKERPVDWLEGSIRVSSPGQEFIRVALEGDSPQDMALVLNAVTQAFLEEVVNKERTVRQERLRKLEGFNRTINEELREKKADLQKLATSLKTTDPGTLSVKRQMEYEYFGQLREEFTRLRFDLMQANLQLAARMKRSEPVSAETKTNEPELSQEELLVSDQLLNERISIDPEYKRVENNIRELEWMVSDRLQRLGPKHPDLVRSQNQLERMLTLSDEVKESIKKRLFIESRASENATIAELQNRVQLLEVEKEHLESELSEWKETEKGVGTLSFELEALKDDIAHSEATANRFRNEIEALTIEIQAPQRITLHRLAEPPTTPQVSKKYKMAGAAGLGMFGLIASGIVFLDFRRKRVNTIDEISGNLRMRIIGAIPSLPRAVLKAVDDNRRPLSSQNVALKSVLREAFDSARAVLMRDSRMHSVETILVTSASDGEGKTSVACQLATSLARAGRKVVLVDCDLRRPTVHRVYGLDHTDGFCEVLRGEAELDNAVQSTQLQNLSIIPAGRVNSQALQLLAEGRAHDIYKHLKEDYEFVVIDSAPLLPVADSLLIAQDVDSVILAIQRDVSRLGNVAAAKQRLEMIGIPLSGAILIGLDEFSNKYGYYSRHYNTMEVH